MSAKVDQQYGMKAGSAFGNDKNEKLSDDKLKFVSPSIPESMEPSKRGLTFGGQTRMASLSERPETLKMSP